MSCGVNQLGLQVHTRNENFTRDNTMTNPVTFEVNKLSSVIFSHMVQKILQQW